MVAIPLVNSGPVTGDGVTDPVNANVSEMYSVVMIKGDSRTGAASDVVLASNPAVKTFRKPLDYIGQKSLGTPAAYEAYARKHIFDVKLDGCASNARVFVGQRKETFAVNLGVIFDLVNIDALGLGAVAQPLGDVLDPTKTTRAKFPNPIANTNITTIAMEVPIACITGTAAAGTAADAGKIIGGWTTASVRQARVINPGPSFAKLTVEGGAWAQVSALKDQFALGAAGCFLGTITAGTNPYGIDTTNAACDPNGFPNGRRPLDDVTDVVLSVVATNFLRTPLAMKVVLHDGVAEEAGFRNADGSALYAGAEIFPYLPTPNGGT